MHSMVVGGHARCYTSQSQLSVTGTASSCAWKSLGEAVSGYGILVQPSLLSRISPSSRRALRVPPELLGSRGLSVLIP